jgi:hypothetical protein
MVQATTAKKAILASVRFMSQPARGVARWRSLLCEQGASHSLGFADRVAIALDHRSRPWLRFA